MKKRFAFVIINLTLIAVKDDKMSKKAKIIVNGIILLLVMAFTVYFLIKSDILTINNLLQIDPWNILLIVLIYLFTVFLLATVNKLAIGNDIPSYTLKDSLAETVYGRLASNITPYKSGHFPLRGYYYAQRNFSLYQMMTGFTKSQIVASISAIITYAVIFIIVAPMNLVVKVNGAIIPLSIVVACGLGVNVLSLILFLMLAFVKPFQRLVIKILSKIRFHKDEEKRNKFIEEQTLKYEIYRIQTVKMLKSFYKYIIPVVLYAVYLIASSSFIYISYVLTSGAQFSIDMFFVFFLLTLGLTYIANVIPIPGGAITSEALFTILFSKYIASSISNQVILLWRISSFYIPTVIIAIIFFIIFIFVNRAPIVAEKKKAKESTPDFMH